MRNYSKEECSRALEVQREKHVKCTQLKAKSFETNKDVCEQKFEALKQLIKERDAVSPKLFMTKITHKNGIGAGTEGKDIVQYCIVYNSKYVIPYEVAATIKKDDTVEDLYQKLLKNCTIIDK